MNMNFSMTLIACMHQSFILCEIIKALSVVNDLIKQYNFAKHDAMIKECCFDS